jgi:hypothetical protein
METHVGCRCGIASSSSCPCPVCRPVVLLVVVIVVFPLSSRTPYAPCEQLLAAVVGGAGCSPMVVVVVALFPSPMLPVSTPRAGAHGGSWGCCGGRGGRSGRVVSHVVVKKL